ncbi:conserved hypothetical protein [Candidatus Desulfarcum epimagneticum]|uniref:Transposase Tn5-like N-terminal domain-containing protein n=1 Tax=uncultured Desulfobacteraceae bacterium TaxID=218296 RepID=A0A484HEB5_9BACT|nr:conserved hypothetical protein [uncultured Desulfobacteraceae bacterium]
MRLCGKYFTQSAIEKIRSELLENPGVSRRELSLKVCRWLSWTSPNGKPKEVSCRKALSALDKKGLIRLPDSGRTYNFQKRAGWMALPVFESLRCDLSELGKITLEPVSGDYRGKKKSREWNSMMDRFHYLGSGPLCGAQIRYLVSSETHGRLGALSHSAGTLRLKDRDEWIGWSPRAHWANIDRVVCNSRFLILPSVNVKNLASRVLSLSLKRLPRDWEERYGYRPALLETFVDPQRFSGVCYRAANWTLIGKTAGRRGRYANGKKCGSPKDIYVYPLQKNFRRVLTRETERPLFAEEREEFYEKWHEEEFGAAEFYDPRLQKRLETLASDMGRRPGRPVSEACGGDMSKIKAAQRFFSHKEVEMRRVLRAHAEASAARIQKRPMALAVRNEREIQIPPGPARLSTLMAIGPDGAPLGLLDGWLDGRPETSPPQKLSGKSREKSEKKSLKNKKGKKDGGWIRTYRAASEIQSHCPDSEITLTGDIRGGIRALFREARKHPRGPKILVRSLQNDGPDRDERKIRRKTAAAPVAGHFEVEVPPGEHGARPRRARLAASRAKILLGGPGGRPMTLWAVWARETAPLPSPFRRVEWLLVSSAPVRSFEDARALLKQRVLSLQNRGWGRTLEKICPSDDPVIQDGDALKNCLAVCMVIAWRICHLKALGKKTPHIPSGLSFPKTRWRAVQARAVRVFGDFFQTCFFRTWKGRAPAAVMAARGPGEAFDFRPCPRLCRGRGRFQ